MLEKYSKGGAAVQPVVSNSWLLFYCYYFITVSQDINRRYLKYHQKRTYLNDIIAFRAPTTATNGRGLYRFLKSGMVYVYIVCFTTHASLSEYSVVTVTTLPWIFAPMACIY